MAHPQTSSKSEALAEVVKPSDGATNHPSVICPLGGEQASQGPTFSSSFLRGLVNGTSQFLMHYVISVLGERSSIS